MIRDDKQVEQVRAFCGCSVQGVFLHAVAAPKADFELTNEQLALIQTIVEKHLDLKWEHKVTLRVEMHQGRTWIWPVV